MAQRSSFDKLDEIDMALILRDANRYLRRLFQDYDTQAEPIREVLRKIMADLQTDEVLKALYIAMDAAQNNQVHCLWLCAAATDLIAEEAAKKITVKKYTKHV